MRWREGCAAAPRSKKAAAVSIDDGPAMTRCEGTWPRRLIKHQDGDTTGNPQFDLDSTPFAPPIGDLQQLSPPPPLVQSTSSATRISPAVLFIIVILAALFFISGLLHVVRFLIKKHRSNTALVPPSTSAAAEDHALQRQLQQLFHLHDAGLDQAMIDTLPVFLYQEIIGAKEPFDCAVCLCEFSLEDGLRLLPLCGHAFHISCIDTWLLSNSTCPLCRAVLFMPGIGFENPIFEFDDQIDEDCSEDRVPTKSEGVAEVVPEKRVFPVRLGKFKNTNAQSSIPDARGMATGIGRREEAESSSSNLDARRCYSMGSYQYVLGNADLRVSLCCGSRRFPDMPGTRLRVHDRTALARDVLDGKKITASSKGDSFSVSKIWQWHNKKGKLPMIPSDDAAVVMDVAARPSVRTSVGNS